MGGSGSILNLGNASKQKKRRATNSSATDFGNGDAQSVGASSEAADVFEAEPYLPNSLINHHQHAPFSHQPYQPSYNVLAVSSNGGGGGNSGRSGGSDRSSSNDDNRIDVTNIHRLSHQLEISSNTPGSMHSSYSNPQFDAAAVTPRVSSDGLLVSAAPAYPTSIPYTPNGDEARVFRYYCPLCMLYFRHILKMKCCGNYTCQQCALEYLTSKGVTTPLPTAPTSSSTPCPHCQCSGFHPVEVSFEEAVRDYSSRTNAVSHGLLEPLHSPLRVGESFEDLKRKMVPYQSIAITTVLTSSPAAHGFQNPNSSSCEATPRSVYDDVIIVQSPINSFFSPRSSGNNSGEISPVESQHSRLHSSQNAVQFNSSGGQIAVMGIAMMNDETTEQQQQQQQRCDSMREIDGTILLEGAASAVTTRNADDKNRIAVDDEASRNTAVATAGSVAATAAAVVSKSDVKDCSGEQFETFSVNTMDLELSADSIGSLATADPRKHSSAFVEPFAAIAEGKEDLATAADKSEAKQRNSSTTVTTTAAAAAADNDAKKKKEEHKAEGTEIRDHTNCAIQFVGSVMQSAMDKAALQ